MYPKLFGVEFLNTYGLCIGVGIILTLWLIDFYAKKREIDKKFCDYFTLLVIVSIILGFLFAGLFQAFYDFLEDPSLGFRFGSMTFIGGLIGGLLTFTAIYFATKGYKLGKVSSFLPIVPCCVTLSHAFGRIGCFLAGCCYGVETTAWYGVRFPGMSVKVVPTQLFESLFLFILCGVMCFLAYKKKDKYNFTIYFICYGIWRFLLEFVRGDDRGRFIGSLSPSQFWSIIMVMCGIGYIFLAKYWLYRRKE